MRRGSRLTALRSAAATRVDRRDRPPAAPAATPAAGGAEDLVQICNGVAEARVKLEGILRRPRGYPAAVVRHWFVATFVMGLPQQTCNSRLW